MSFLRKLSFSSTKSCDGSSVTLPPLLLTLKNKRDSWEEINNYFSLRDVDLFAPMLVKDMSWERFNERVLECGCGTGKTSFTHFLPEIYMHDSHLYSVDGSESLISYACMKYPHPSVTFAVGDVMSDNFPFKWTTFDKIFALHCVKDYCGVLKKFFALLRPGGQLGLIFASHLYCDHLDNTFAKDEAWSKYFKGAQNEGENVYKTFQENLETFGYEVIKIKTEVMEYNFTSLEKAVVYYMATSPFVKSIPAELQISFEQYCLAIAMKNFNLRDISEEFNMTYSCLYVVAKKPGFPQKEKKIQKKSIIVFLLSKLDR